MTTYRSTKKITLMVAVVFGIAIVAYSLFQARNIILGPEITLITPSDGTAVTDPLIMISGKTRNAFFISLNDRPIFVDQQGNFREELLLSSGYNNWTVSATDKFGRTTSKNFSLVLRNS